MPVTVQCSYCGKEKQVKPSCAGRDNMHFCDGACYGKWRSRELRGENATRYNGGSVKLTCDRCGVEYEIPKAWDKYKTHFCSRPCANAALADRMRGRARRMTPGLQIAQEKARRRSEERRRATCVVCGAEFLKAKPSSQTKCCSRKCGAVLGGQNNTKGVVVHCLHCGKELWATAAVRRKFCSRTCFGAYKAATNGTDRTCVVCGTAFHVPNARMRRGDACDVCSHECYKAWCRSDRNPRWKGGTTSEKSNWTSSRDGRRFVRECKRRDDYTCARCKTKFDKRSRELHVHHKAPWAKYEALRGEPDNGIALCFRCHCWVHSKAGRHIRLKWQAQALRHFGYGVHGETVQLPLLQVA
jgi:hypothetical protein